MCSMIVHILFIVLLAAGTIMTIVSLATPAWKEYHNSTIADSAKNKDYKAVVGLFKGTCGGSGEWGGCKDYYNNAPDWQKAAIAFLFLSLLASGAGLIWSVVACMMCCCKSCLMPPLPILAGLACVCDIIGVTIYGVKSGHDLGGVPIDYKQLNDKTTFGYSFWIGIGAIITLFIDTIVGVALVKTSQVAPV